MVRWGTNPLGPYQKVILPWHRPETPDQHEENVRALERIDWGSGEGTRWGTLVLAAADSTDLSKSTADYVCPGSADQITIGTAITSLLTRTRLGRIVFLEGTYTFSALLTITFTAGQTLTLEGQGSINGVDVTRFTAASSGLFSFVGASGGASYVAVRGIGFNCGTNANIIQTAKTSIEADRCSFQGSSASGLILNGGIAGPYSSDYVHDCYFSCGGSRGVEVTNTFGARIDDNNFANGSCVASVRVLGNVGATGDAHIVGNVIAGATGVWLVDTLDSTNAQNTLIAGNRFVGCSTTAIACTSTSNTAILTNTFKGCAKALSVGSGVISGNFYSLFANNYIYDTTGTRSVSIGGSTLGTGDWAILFNKFRGTTPAYAIEISGGVSNCAVAFNDTYQGYSTSPVLDNGTSTRREKDFFDPAGQLVPAGGTTGQVLEKLSNLDYATGWATIHEVLTGGTQYQVLGKNSATNFDYGWINSPIQVKKNGGALVGTEPILNFIEGSNVTMTIADNPGATRLDITINQTASSGGNASGQLVAIFDAGSTALSPPLTCDIVAPFAGTITDWEVFCSPADTVSVAIWKDSYVNYPPTIADIITASAPITTSAAVKNASSTLTGWTTGITAGDVYRFVLNTSTLATKITVVVNYSRP